MKVLGIETSCDETAVGLYCDQQGLLAHRVYTQALDHAPYGGVVPELAARDHIRKLLPLVDSLLEETNSKSTLDAVAYTAGPGLAGALMVGASLGRTLAWAWGCRAVAVNHLEAHVLAAMLETDAPEPPFLALLVSGGHTLLIEVNEVGSYRCIGESVDDAAGEAFDKVAQLLGLGYPGGPQVARLAKQGQSGRFHLPRPMINQSHLNFSFSGLKTRVLYELQACERTEQDRADIARAFEEAVVDTLVTKCQKALHQTRLNQLVISGGVGANAALRAALTTRLNGCRLHYPRIEFCTDNGAMIAYTGWRQLKRGSSQSSLGIQVHPKWPL